MHTKTPQHWLRLIRSPGGLALVALCMFGFGYALTPLYDLFCDITGLNGKVSRAVETPADDIAPAHTVTVRFPVHNQAQAVRLTPVADPMSVRTGEVQTAYFDLTNLSARQVEVRAIPSVSPGRAASALRKTDCFCFDALHLAATEQRRVAVRFVVAPDINRHYQDIALGYTLVDVPST